MLVGSSRRRLIARYLLRPPKSTHPVGYLYVHLQAVATYINDTITRAVDRAWHGKTLKGRDGMYYYYVMIFWEAE